MAGGGLTPAGAVGGAAVGMHESILPSEVASPIVFHAGRVWPVRIWDGAEVMPGCTFAGVMGVAPSLVCLPHAPLEVVLEAVRVDLGLYL